MELRKEIFDFSNEKILTYTQSLRNVNDRLEYLLFVFKEIKITQSILTKKIFYNYSLKLLYDSNKNFDLSTPHVIDYISKDIITNSDKEIFLKWISEIGSSFLQSTFSDLFSGTPHLSYKDLVVYEEGLLEKIDELRTIITSEIQYQRDLMRLQVGEDQVNKSTQHANYKEDKIKWNGTESQLVYLFDLLFKYDLLSASEYYDENYSLISKYFINKRGQNIESTKLQESKNKIEKDIINKKQAKQIENIIEKLKP